MHDESRLPPEMSRVVEVRAISRFELGDKMIEPGQIVRVSRSRGEYLHFLGLAEMDMNQTDEY